MKDQILKGNLLLQGKEVRLGQAERADREFIALLSRKVFSHYGPYEEIVPKWFESKTVITIIARMDGHPVGFIMLGYFSGRYDLEDGSELLAIAVVPEMQRTGIGEMLLNRIEKEAARLNIKILFLHTALENIPARSLFHRNGYRPWEVKIRFYPLGQDAIVMAKKLTDQAE